MKKTIKQPAKSAEPSGLIWGAEAIGTTINRSPRATYHLHESGKTTSIKKVGGTLVASRSKLLNEFGG